MSLTLEGNDVLRWTIALVALAIVVVAVVISKSRPIAVSDADSNGSQETADINEN